MSWVWPAGHEPTSPRLAGERQRSRGQPTTRQTQSSALASVLAIVEWPRWCGSARGVPVEVDERERADAGRGDEVS